jgi:hypothetical protein
MGVNKKANPTTLELAFRDPHSPIAAVPKKCQPSLPVPIPRVSF